MARTEHPHLPAVAHDLLHLADRLGVVHPIRAEANVAGPVTKLHRRVLPWLRLYRFRYRARDVGEQVEELPLARRVDAPVHRHQLIAVHIVASRGAAADAFARIEVAPGRMPTHG